MNIAALSLWEPWASLMRCGAKTIETRTWPTSYRGPLLICAAKRWTRSQYDYLYSVPVQNAFWKVTGRTPTAATALLIGKAGCIVNMTQCLATGSIGCATPAGERVYRDRHFGDYTCGRFAWFTNDLRADFEPFPVTGQQGLFQVELPEGITL